MTGRTFNTLLDVLFEESHYLTLVERPMPESEIPIIFEKATKKYPVDKTRMHRYASRRNAEQTINMLEKGTWFQVV